MWKKKHIVESQRDCFYVLKLGKSRRCYNQELGHLIPSIKRYTLRPVKGYEPRLIRTDTFALLCYSGIWRQAGTRTAVLIQFIIQQKIKNHKYNCKQLFYITSYMVMGMCKAQYMAHCSDMEHKLELQHASSASHRSSSG